MLKKILAVIFAMLALLALSACGLFSPAQTEEVMTFDVSEFTESEPVTIVDTGEEDASIDDTSETTADDTPSFDVVGTFACSSSYFMGEYFIENPEMVSRISFEEDGTCSVYVNYLQGGCFLPGEYNLFEKEIHIKIDASGTPVDGYVLEEYVLYIKDEDSLEINKELYTIKANDPLTRVVESKPAYTEPPLTEEELAMKVPEFLDEDQQALFRKATNVYAHLWGSYADLIEYEEALEQKIDKTKYARVRDENGRVYTISRGLYKDWDNFTTLVHSVFTEEAFAKQNSNLYFVEHNGKLAFDNNVGRKNYKYNPYFEEEFELVSKTDSEVIFSITAYYSSWSALSPKELAKNMKYESMEQREERLKAGWEWTESYTVSMVKTEDGWRFAEFHDAEIDAKEVTENKHYSFIGTYIWRYSSVEDALEDENTETIPRITFYEDGTCKILFRLKRVFVNLTESTVLKILQS